MERGAQMIFSDQPERVIGRISAIAHNPDSLDEDEPPPSENTLQHLTGLLLEAAGKLDNRLPQITKVSACYGEINATWRVGDSIVRVASFPSGKALVQWGNVSSAIGSYKSEPASGELLARRLKTLYSVSAAGSANC